MSISLSASFNATSAFFAKAIESATIGPIRPTDGSAGGNFEVLALDIGFKLFLTLLVAKEFHFFRVRHRIIQEQPETDRLNSLICFF